MSGDFDTEAWLGALLGPTVPGIPVTEPAARTRPVELVRSVAEFLTRLHAVDPGVAPDRSPAVVLSAVAGSSPSDDESRAGLIDGATALLPAPPLAPVATFGGLRLDTLQISDGRVCAWEASEWAGVGDPAWDIASLARDLGGLVGPEAGALLLDAYVGEAPGVLRLEFWALIDRLR